MVWPSDWIDSDVSHIEAVVLLEYLEMKWRGNSTLLKTTVGRIRPSQGTDSFVWH